MGGFRRAAAAGFMLACGLGSLAISARPATAQLHMAIEARATLLARAYNAAGQQLYAKLSAKPGNVVFSPYSVGTAMAMALAGARGDTASEMARAMSHRMATDAINTANGEMIAILNGYDHSADAWTCPAGAALKDRKCDMRPANGRQCGPGMTLEAGRCTSAATPPRSARVLTANALMLARRGDLISDDYVTLLKTRYAAEVFKRATLADVNGWVDRKTEGKIDRIVDRIDQDAAAVLLNAVYFKARWAEAFDKKETQDAAFNVSRSEAVKVPTMNQSGSFSVVSRGGYRAVRLPYEIPELSMVIVLPDSVDGVDNVGRRLGAEELTELFTALRGGQAKKPIALALPRFKATFQADLVPPFKELGIRKAFAAGDADFSGMISAPASQEKLFIEAIAHRAVIEVSEESTEAAAAATAVTSVRVASVPPPPEPFRVDRPFLFYVLDDPTGAILFEGRIVDPR